MRTSKKKIITPSSRDFITKCNCWNRPFFSLLLYICFTLFTFPSASRWNFLPILHWLPCIAIVVSVHQTTIIMTSWKMSEAEHNLQWGAENFLIGNLENFDVSETGICWTVLPEKPKKSYWAIKFLWNGSKIYIIGRMGFDEWN